MGQSPVVPVALARGFSIPGTPCAGNEENAKPGWKGPHYPQSKSMKTGWRSHQFLRGCQRPSLTTVVSACREAPRIAHVLGTDNVMTD